MKFYFSVHFEINLTKKTNFISIQWKVGSVVTDLHGKQTNMLDVYAKIHHPLITRAISH